MSSKAHTLFHNTHERGYWMVESSVSLWTALFSNQENAEPTIEQYNERNVFSDMGRAGIVLAVSAFDDFFTRRFAECVVPMIKKGGAPKTLVHFLENCGLDVEASLQLLTMQRPYRRIRKLVDDHLSQRTTQKFREIDRLFKCIGLQTLTDQAEKKTGRTTLKASCQKIILRRHKIAHQGDTNKRGKLVPLSYKDTRQKLSDLKKFVDAAHEVIAEKTGCK